MQLVHFHSPLQVHALQLEPHIVLLAQFLARSSDILLQKCAFVVASSLDFSQFLDSGLVLLLALLFGVGHLGGHLRPVQLDVIVAVSFNFSPLVLN